MEEEQPPLIKLQIKEEGRGAFVQPGDRVYVYYRGMLPDGKVFASNEQEDYALSFTVGEGEVI